ncbi:uncharacterized protein LOC126419192 [Schistocerca serialis cubense]|uniref:uncharacterized protein LOC126419192 n=1 Tax=Schistocerca serialis cubense TaxID=2023355 RepID=UPI00214E7B5C|nr:uncharacterized protein LOC126419192 [Schistocerca serialis cubense]
MAAVSAVLSAALALLAAFNSAHAGQKFNYTTSDLFDHLVQPLCAESSTDDACYGCFTRYGMMVQAPDAYEELKKCARKYLNGTSFAQCQAVIWDAEVNEDGQSPVFCDFEVCVRKWDMLQLVDACANQNRSTKSEAEKYVQTTFCIVDELRRRKFMIEPRDLYGYYSSMTYALYVTEDGELRVTMTHGVVNRYSCDAS